MAGLALIVAPVLVLLLYGIHGRSSKLFGESVWRGRGRRRSVALTFDDGPSEATLELARYLEEEGIRGTFFMCGVNVQRNPGVARALHEAGHELGNHTQNHRRLCPRLGWKLNVLAPRDVWEEIAEAQEWISRDAGVAPMLFRAPYGMRWFGVREAQRRLGLLGVMWTTIGHDWEWDGERVSNYLMKSLRPGAIFCLHDGRDTRPCPDVASTLEAVRLLVPQIKAAGYGFETVSELLGPNG